MALIADIFLVAGALGAALYCHILSRRLRRFTDLENGVGGAVAVLALQVEGLDAALKKAQDAASSSVSNLDDVNARAESAARKLELLMASLHDMPAASEPKKRAKTPFFVQRDTTEPAL